MFILPRQLTDYTCGPAALAAVTVLLGHEIHEESVISEKLDCKPFIGVSSESLVEYAKDIGLKIGACGEDTYQGGLAIANVKSKPRHIGHYVVLLGERDGIIRYYCPFGKVFEEKPADMLWENGDGTVKNWSVSFETEGGKDFYDAEIEAARHVFIIADPLHTLIVELDSTLIIKKAYEDQGQSVTWHLVEDIFTAGRQLQLSGVPVLKQDIVWMRCDPVNSVAYYELQRRLAHMDAHIVNDPKVILNFHDKLSTLYIEEMAYLTASSAVTLDKALGQLQVQGFEKFVIKAPSLFGGEAVVLAENTKEAHEAMENLLHHSGYVMLQGFIKTGERQIDKRVFVTMNTLIGPLDRVAAEGAFLCNMHAGAKPAKPSPMTEVQKQKTAKIQAMMRREGIFMAGIDFIGDSLIEINITCPSALIQINEFNGIKSEDILIEEAWDSVDRGQRAVDS